jgi:hypothetical protein
MNISLTPELERRVDEKGEQWQVCIRVGSDPGGASPFRGARGEELKQQRLADVRRKIPRLSRCVPRGPYRSTDCAHFARGTGHPKRNAKPISCKLILWRSANFAARSTRAAHDRHFRVIASVVILC